MNQFSKYANYLKGGIMAFAMLFISLIILYCPFHVDSDVTHSTGFHILAAVCSLVVLFLVISPHSNWRISLGRIATLYETLAILCALHLLLSKRHFTAYEIFDNNAGYAAILSISCVITLHRITICFLKDKFKFIFHSTVFALLVFALIAADSRTGYIATTAGISTLFLFRAKMKGTRKFAALFLVVTIIAVLLALLYGIRPTSAQGRLLIWKVSLSAILEKPLFGHGPNGFASHYMLYQAQYFKGFEMSSPFDYIAGNTLHPMNEFIKVLFDYGIVGFSIIAAVFVILFRKALSITSNQSHPVIYATTMAIVGLSMFSYPLHYPVIILFIALCSFSILTETFQKKRFARVTAIFVSTVTMGFSIMFTIYDFKWNSAKKNIGISWEWALDNYASCYPILSHDYRFVYNYAAVLNAAKDFENSIIMAERCSKLIFDYDVCLLFIDNLINLEKYEDALSYCEIAENMIPSKFTPLYAKMIILDRMGKKSEASDIAYEIISKPIKIHSARLSRIIREAEIYSINQHF